MTTHESTGRMSLESALDVLARHWVDQVVVGTMTAVGVLGGAHPAGDQSGLRRLHGRRLGACDSASRSPSLSGKSGSSTAMAR